MGQPDLELYSGRITWDLGGAVGDPKTVVDYDTNFQGKVKLKGLPIGHTKIALTKDDHARVTATVNLPFWPFKYFDSLSASPTFVTDNYHGANFGGLEIKFDKVEALGIGLKDVDINYVSGNTWSGMQWDANSWSANSWSGSSWKANSWSANSWSARRSSKTN